MWLWTPLSEKVGWVLAVVFVVFMLVVAAGLVWVVVTTGPAAVEQWNAADARERDTVILLVVVVSWLTRGSKTTCKCSGECGRKP